MIKLITINSELESARRLGLPTFVGSPQGYMNDEKNNIWIRWGNSRIGVTRSSVEKDFPNVINPAAAIRFNCDKFQSKKKISTVALVPKTFTASIPKGVTAVVRPYEHSSGQDFKIIQGEYELSSGEYGSEFIRTNKEVRVWFCGKDSMMALRVPLKDSDDKETKCRSNWGYSFVYKQTPIEIYKSVMAAANKLNLKFGAADILLHAGKHYILELNSSPTIDLVKLERFFKKNLFKLLRQEFGKDFDKLAELEKLEKQGFNFADSEF